MPATDFITGTTMTSGLTQGAINPAQDGGWTTTINLLSSGAFVWTRTYPTFEEAVDGTNRAMVVINDAMAALDVAVQEAMDAAP
jgi:hypothetical protein